MIIHTREIVRNTMLSGNRDMNHKCGDTNKTKLSNAFLIFNIYSFIEKRQPCQAVWAVVFLIGFTDHKPLTICSYETLIYY